MVFHLFCIGMGIGQNGAIHGDYSHPCCKQPSPLCNELLQLFLIRLLRGSAQQIT